MLFLIYWSVVLEAFGFVPGPFMLMPRSLENFSNDAR